MSDLNESYLLYLTEWTVQQWYSVSAMVAAYLSFFLFYGYQAFLGSFLNCIEIDFTDRRYIAFFWMIIEDDRNA